MPFHHTIRKALKATGRGIKGVAQSDRLTRGSTALKRHREMQQSKKESIRVAGAALKQAFSEASPAQQAQLRRGGFNPVPRLQEGHPTAFVGGRVSYLGGFFNTRRGRVTFGTTKGKLANPAHTLVGTARHEVAHLLGAGHFDISATSGIARHAGEKGTASGLRGVSGTIRLPLEQKVQRALKRRVVSDRRRGDAGARRREEAAASRSWEAARQQRQQSRRMRPMRPAQQAAAEKTRARLEQQRTPLSQQGFQTPHLRAAAETGAPKQRRRSRDLMRKLGRRLKPRVDF